MNRTELIRAHLATNLLRDHGVAVVTPHAEAWLRHEAFGSWPFGWAVPMPVDDDDHLLIVAFSPEVIAKTTEHLDNEHLEVYLATIEAFLAAYIEEPSADTNTVRHLVEDHLYADYPDALRLMTEVEALALSNLKSA